MDNCADMVNRIKQNPNMQLVEYLQKQYDNLLKNNNIREIIYTSLPIYSEEENIDAIIEIMNKIKQLKN